MLSIIKFLEIELFIIFVYYPFNVCRMNSDRSSVISGTSNLYILSFFSFVSFSVDLYFLIIFVFLCFFFKIAIYVIFYLFKQLVIGKFLFLNASVSELLLIFLRFILFEAMLLENNLIF